MQRVRHVVQTAWTFVIVVCLLGTGTKAADEFTAPPKAERDILAAIGKLGGQARVDGEYRLLSLTIAGECTNDELKGLAACERLTSLSLSSPKITDAGLEHLKGLTKVTSISISTSGTTTEGIAALRAALPNCRITTFGRGAFPASSGSPANNPPGGGGQFPSGFAGGSLGSELTRTFNLVRNNAIQDDLKLTTEQRTKITDATSTAAYTAYQKSVDEKMRAWLTPEQLARLKQLELQQLGMNAFNREEVVKQLKITPEQVAGIRKQYDEASAAARVALQELTARGGGGNETPDDRSNQLRTKMAELSKQREEKVLAQLNEEQRKAWQEMVGTKGPVVNGSFADQVVVGRDRSRPVLSAADAAKTIFERYDTDKDGKISEAEFPATNRTRISMTAAGITLEFPVPRATFESTYGKYYEGDRRRR